MGSLMGQGRWLDVSEIDAYGCLRSLRAHLALDGVSWVQSGSVEIAVGQTDRALHNRRRHLLPPRHRSARELGSISCSAEAAWLCWLELGAVPQHGMHDNGETTGERDLAVARRRARHANRRAAPASANRR